MLQDNLGSVRDVVDNEGEVVNRIDYDPFGNILSSVDPSDDEAETDLATRFLFTGQEWDGDLGLYYYNARWYDAVVGKFISRDPLGFDAGDANLYRYVGNSPVNWTDPTGLEALTVDVVAKSYIDGVGAAGAIVPVTFPKFCGRSQRRHNAVKRSDRWDAGSGKQIVRKLSENTIIVT